MAPIITWTTTLLATNLLYSFSSDKMIHIVEYGSNQYESYIGVSPNKYTVEKFGKKVDALVAINGGYHGFNSPEQRGPITRLQIDDELVVPYNNMTILTENGLDEQHVEAVLSIDSSRHVVSIDSSENGDPTFIYSGPLLLKNGVPTNVNNKWGNARNPRTIVCTRGNKVLFIVVDGRRQDVTGMTLTEAQSLLIDVGCENAINMDGGGSTTMYIKGYGIVNTPRSSDGKGNYTTIARSVSSIIYI